MGGGRGEGGGGSASGLRFKVSGLGYRFKLRLFGSCNGSPAVLTPVEPRKPAQLWVG